MYLIEEKKLHTCISKKMHSVFSSGILIGLITMGQDILLNSSMYNYDCGAKMNSKMLPIEMCCRHDCFLQLIFTGLWMQLSSCLILLKNPWSFRGSIVLIWRLFFWKAKSKCCYKNVNSLILQAVKKLQSLIDLNWT